MVFSNFVFANSAFLCFFPFPRPLQCRSGPRQPLLTPPPCPFDPPKTTVVRCYHGLIPSNVYTSTVHVNYWPGQAGVPASMDHDVYAHILCCTRPPRPDGPGIRRVSKFSSRATCTATTGFGKHNSFHETITLGEQSRGAPQLQCLFAVFDLQSLSGFFNSKGSKMLKESFAGLAV